MIRALRGLAGATAIAAVIGGLRQRLEARGVRNGSLPRASAAADVPARTPIGPWAARLSSWIPEPPQTAGGKIAACVMAAPLTLVGFLAATVAHSRPEWDPDFACFVAKGARGPSRKLLSFLGADANTIGQVVLCTRNAPSPTLLAHESVHARQAERLGLAQFPLYVWLSARYGYRDNPLERAARLGARRWIRSGQGH